MYHVLFSSRLPIYFLIVQIICKKNNMLHMLDLICLSFYLFFSLRKSKIPTQPNSPNLGAMSYYFCVVWIFVNTPFSSILKNPNIHKPNLNINISAIFTKFLLVYQVITLLRVCFTIKLLFLSLEATVSKPREFHK